MQQPAIRVRCVHRHRLGRPQTRHLPASCRQPTPRDLGPRASAQGHRRLGSRASRALRRPAHRRLPSSCRKARSSRPSSSTTSSSSSQSTRAPSPSTAAPSPPVAPKTIRPMPPSPSTSPSSPRQARAAAPREPRHARPQASRRGPPRSGARPRSHHQPPDLHSEGLLPAGSRVVSRQGDRSLRRVPRALAVSCPTPNAPIARPSSTSSTPTASADAAVIDRRIEAIKSERPLTSDAAVIEPARLLVEALLPQLRAVSDGITRLDDEIARRCQQLPDFRPLRRSARRGPRPSPLAFSPPSASNASASPTPPPFRSTAGIAPVTERSGNKHWVHWRWACPNLPAPDLRRMGRQFHPTFLLGPRLLREPHGQGRVAQRHHPCPRLQVDPHPLPLLGRPHPLRRIPLPRRAPEAPLPPAQIRRRPDLHNSLAVRLRARVSRPPSRPRLASGEDDPLVTKGRHQFKLAAKGGDVAAEGGYETLLEVLSTLESRDV